jgi:hypothetical protein
MSKKTVHMLEMTVEIDLDSFEPVSLEDLTQEDLDEIVLGAETWRDMAALKEIELNRLRKELTALLKEREEANEIIHRIIDLMLLYGTEDDSVLWDSVAKELEKWFTPAND